MDIFIIIIIVRLKPKIIHIAELCTGLMAGIRWNGSILARTQESY